MDEWGTLVTEEMIILQTRRATRRPKLKRTMPMCLVKKAKQVQEKQQIMRTNKLNHYFMDLRDLVSHRVFESSKQVMMMIMIPM